MTIARLLSYPVTLIHRENTGDEDAWGNPLVIETRISTTCYYRVVNAEDSDDGGGDVKMLEVEVFLAADSHPGPYDAIELDFAGKLEVIGQPAPELNARTGKVSHLKLRAKQAGP